MIVLFISIAPLFGRVDVRGGNFFVGGIYTPTPAPMGTLQLEGGILGRPERSALRPPAFQSGMPITALKKRSSVTGTYSARPLSWSIACSGPTPG